MRVLVGIRPTGRLHIGHYFSVIKPAIEEKAYVLVANYHAPDIKERLLLDFIQRLRTYVPKNKILLQSQNFNPQLYFALLKLARMGELQRMTQYKFTKKYKDAHLLTYPVLMAHDVIDYDKVIVGDDQKQHLEFSKVLITRYNKSFNTNHIIPEGDYRGGRVMDLLEPRKKMSKSNAATCLFLDDDELTIEHKISRAITTQEGIENLAFLYKEFVGKEYDSNNNYEMKVQLSKAIREKFC